MATVAAHVQPAAAPAVDPPTPPSNLTPLVVLLRFSALMAALLAIASLPTSSLLSVRSVRVQGAGAIPAAHIIALTGLRPGDRLFAVPAAEVVRRVSRHPRVGSAAVHVGRSGVITVRISERAPYAAFPVQDRYLILDRAGVVIDDRPLSSGLPVVTADGSSPEWIRLGDRLPSSGVQRALAALGRLPRGVIGPGVRVRGEVNGDLVLFTPDGIAVRLGPLRGLEERSALMDEILDAVRTRGLAVEYLDLRFSGSVVMKPLPRDAAGEGDGR